MHFFPIVQLLDNQHACEIHNSEQLFGAGVTLQHSDHECDFGKDVAVKTARCPEWKKNEKAGEGLCHRAGAQRGFGTPMGPGLYHLWTHESTRDLPLYHPKFFSR